MSRFARESGVSPLTVVTINIFSDLSRWEERRGLLADSLTRLSADVIAVQEASVPGQTARWLAQRTGMPYLHFTPKTGQEGQNEGIALLSRLPFENQIMLPLGGQERVAQAVQVRQGEQSWVIANTHLFWQPGDSPERVRQVERLQNWLAESAGALPVVVCGDFNAEPQSAAVQRMHRGGYTSAHRVVHGVEPLFTTPTPLPRSKRLLLANLVRFLPYLRLKDLRLGYRGTLDYIFVNERVEVLDCRVALDQPAPNNPQIYPSDHFGLVAELEAANRVKG